MTDDQDLENLLNEALEQDEKVIETPFGKEDVKDDNPFQDAEPEQQPGTEDAPETDQKNDEEEEVDDDPAREEDPAQEQKAKGNSLYKDLKTERKKRQELEGQLSQLQAQTQQLQAYIQQQAQPAQAERNEDLDLYEPEQLISTVQQQSQLEGIRQRVQFSEMLALREHGQELVNEATAAAARTGMNERFVFAADPIGEAVKWYKEQLIAQEIGGDLDGYKEKMRAELQAELDAKMADTLRKGQGGQQTNTSQKIPPSLGSKTSASSGGEVVLANEEFFNSEPWQKK